MLVLLTFTLMVSAPIMCVGGIVMALREDLGLAWLIVVSVTVLVGGDRRSSSAGWCRCSGSCRSRIDSVNRILREQITGIRVVRAFVREPVERERFGVANAELTETALRVGQLMAFMFPTVLLVLNVSSVAVLWFGGHRIDAGRDADRRDDRVPQLPAADPHVDHDGDVHARDDPAGRGVRRAAHRGAGHRAVGRPAGRGRDRAAGAGQRRAARGVVQLSRRRAPRCCATSSLRAEPGTTTAIVGSTGSGKTTLLSLVPRLFDATAGTVLVDGVDVTDHRARDAVRPDRARPAAGVPVHRHDRRPTCATASPTPPTRSSGTRCAWPRPRTSWRRWPRACTRRSPRAAPTSPAGSGSGWRSPGRSYGGRRSTCSTTPSRRWTWPPTRGCARRCARSPATRAVIVVAQRVSTIVDADQIVVLEDGVVVGLGTHDELRAQLPDVRRDRASPSCPRRRRHEPAGPHAYRRRRRPTRTGRRRARPGRLGDVGRDAGREVDGLLAVRASGCWAGWRPERMLGLPSCCCWPSPASRSPSSGRRSSATPPTIIFEGVIGKQLPAGITQQQAIDAARARGDDGFANLLSGMTVVPGQGVDFTELGHVLLVVLVLYVVSAVCMWRSGPPAGRRGGADGAAAARRGRGQAAPPAAELLRHPPARRAAQPGDQRHRQRPADHAADDEPAAQLAADARRRARR